MTGFAARGRVCAILASCVATGFWSGCSCQDPTAPTTGTTILWRRAEPRSATNAPLVDGDLAIFTLLREPVVVAVSAETGARRWERRISIPAGALSGLFPAEGDVAAAGGLILVPAWDLVALDRTTGVVHWTFAPPDDYPASTGIAVSDDRVLTGGRRLYALDVQTGAKIWETTTLGDRVADPVVAGAVVLVTSRTLIPGTPTLGNGWLHAVDISTGVERWRVELSNSEAARGGGVRHPVVAGTFVLQATNDGRVVAVDRGTGTLRWTYTIDAVPASRSLEGGVAVVGGTVVTAGLAGVVVGLDLETGAELWTGSFMSSVVAQITTDGDQAFVSSGWIQAYQPTGTLSWTHGGAINGGPGYLTPARVAGDRLYVGAEDELVALTLGADTDIP